MSSGLNRRAVLAAMGVCTLPAFADTFPSKTVTVVMPFAAGGPSDQLVRPVAQRLSTIWKQSVILDPRSGANGIIATQFAMRAPPDGHTLLHGTIGLVQNLSLHKRVPYDFSRDLQPVAIFGRQPQVIVVPTSSPYNNIGELIAAIKANRQAFSFGSVGNGSSSHIFGELLNRTLGTQMPHVAYKGEAALLPDLVTGRIPMSFVSAATAVVRERSQNLRSLAVSGTSRLPMLPNVPTLAESGMAGFELTGWYAMFLPAGVPNVVANKISADLQAVIAEPEIQAKLDELALLPQRKRQSIPELVAEMRADEVAWTRAIKALNISSD